MGFYLRCAIAKVDDAALAERIVAAATDLFPPFVHARRFGTPWAGVIAAYDPARTQETIGDDFAAHGYADEDAASEDIYEAIESRIGHLSHEFPDVPFAFVDVDCFGGTCMYHGFVVLDATQTHREPTSQSAHVRLFERLGVVDPEWHFAPFTRGFMDTGVASDLSRRPATFYVHAQWDEPFRLASIRASLLPPPWKVTILTETSCVVVYDDDFYASMHPVDDHVELNGRSFVDATLTKTLAHELTEDHVALDVKEADHG